MLQGGDGVGADHPTIGDDADVADCETAAQAVDDGNEGCHIGGIARPHLRADRPAVLVDDDADDHLVQVRPIVLGVATLADFSAALALEIQRGGVHEHHRQVSEEVAPARKQSLLDEIFDATRHQRAISLLRRR